MKYIIEFYKGGKVFATIKDIYAENNIKAVEHAKMYAHINGINVEDCDKIETKEFEDDRNINTSSTGSSSRQK